MKRTGYLYEKIMTLENVLAAWELFNSRRPPFLRREVDRAEAARILRLMKTDFVAVIGRPKTRPHYESGKWRILQVPSFDSVIAQTAMWNICGPLVEKRIHDFSFSSRKNKGGHLAARKVERFVHQHGKREARYCLYFDIKKYYQHINCRILMSRIETVIKDARVLEMFRIVLDSANEGLPIGYPFSHALANLFLVPLYFLIHSVKGISRVFVYMDNWTVFSRTKKALHIAKKFAANWLDQIGCAMKHDWQIFPTAARGVKICGFVITHGASRLYRSIWHRTLRALDVYRFKPSRHLYLSLMSRLGWLKAIHQEYNPIFKVKGGYVWKKK